MLTTFRQRERRDGIKLVTVSFPVPVTSSDDLYNLIARAVTPKTKLILICHITNRTGVIFPVRRIADMAHARGIPLMVDGAHAFNHFPYKLSDLNCDYYGVSLHKWTCAPIGTGFLYVRKSRIAQTWSLMASDAKQANDIRKFEEIGTHPAANHNGVAAALSFHRAIGADRKAARLRYLRNRWVTHLAGASPRARLLSPSESERSCGIGLLHVDGIDPATLKGRLWDKHRIITVSIKHAEFSGLRVTPNVDTSVEDVDVFVEAVLKTIKAIG
jgi:selenocysteine lyase/cysteine desulfurase